MQIVINIAESRFEHLREGLIPHGCIAEKMILKAVKEGVPLPKGHGRLIDADAVVLDDIDFFDGWDYVTACNAINDAPTIIEAETEDT